MEHTTQETVERTIFSEVHKKRYTLTGEAPICNRELFQDLGCQANTKASRAVLDGTYEAPTTSDKATRDLFTEIAAIRRLIPENSVKIIITPEQWKQYWRVMNEETLIRHTFRALYRGIQVGHNIPLSCVARVCDPRARNPTGEMVSRTISHA